MSVFNFKEKPLEKIILDYLNRIPNSYTIKHELAGRPIKKGNYYILIPFKNKFFRKGHSDVTFLFNKTSYYFEIKTPKELKWWINKYPSVKHLDPSTLKEKKDKKVKHFLEQQIFINNVNSTGNYAEMVDSLEKVQKVIEKALLEASN